MPAVRLVASCPVPRPEKVDRLSRPMLRPRLPPEKRMAPVFDAGAKLPLPRGVPAPRKNPRPFF